MNDSQPGDEPLLSVRDLTVRFRTSEGSVEAVNGLSFDLDESETLAIVGESGAGKSVASLAVMGLLGPEAIVAGSVKLRGRELIGLRDRDMRKIRGKDIAMVFQDAMTSLNPVFTVGNQIVEALTAHDSGISKRDAHDRAIELLDVVGIAAAAKRVNSFPHEMSGGMRQRAMIAIAIANDPSVLIADEPTTALDVTIQAQVMEAFEAAQEATGAAIMLITHDLGLVANYADRIQVMYGGLVFEAGTTDEVFARPRNPYTIGLLNSIPRPDRREESLHLIRGAPPSAGSTTQGCAFGPRCDYADDHCTEVEPSLHLLGDSHATRCHYAETLGDRVSNARRTDPPPTVTTRNVRADDEREPEVILEVDDMTKEFVSGGRFFGGDRSVVKAVNGVSLRVGRRESLGIVGESGSGKTTLARCILRMIEPTSGSIRYRGNELTAADARALRALRTELQLVFQDPYASLNPRMTVAELIGEPMRIHRWSRGDIAGRIDELLDAVGLAPEHALRYPHEFSGGQRQRIGIARALALGPDLVILDEPVSALDVSVQAQVLNMLSRLQVEFDLSFVYIAHDLSVVRHVSDRVAVMYLGRVVETGLNNDLYDRPAHPYTQALLSAVPLPDPDKARRRDRIVLEGDIPDPAQLPSGCAFHTRCPVAQEICAEVDPTSTVLGNGHEVACHFPLGPNEQLVERIAAVRA